MSVNEQIAGRVRTGAHGRIDAGRTLLLSPEPRVPDGDSPYRPSSLNSAAGGGSDEDANLIARGIAGDSAAWGRLLTRYQDRLFTTCLRIVRNPDVAADLTQDAFVRIIQGIGGYDGRSAFLTWATRITMNVCLSHLRKQRHRGHASLDASYGPGIAGRIGASEGSSLGDGLPQPRELDPVSGVERDEQHRGVLDGLARLDPEQRTIIVLRDVQGLDYAQIAEALEIAVGTVKSRLFRARLALRMIMESMAEGTLSAPSDSEA